MTEKGENLSQQEPEVYVHGTKKPKTAPPGRQWYPVRGRDPSKNPRAISGWRQGPKPTPQGEFTLPAELERFRGELIQQDDFLDKAGKPDKPKSDQGNT